MKTYILRKYGHHFVNSHNVSEAQHVRECNHAHVDCPSWHHGQQNHGFVAHQATISKNLKSPTFYKISIPKTHNTQIYLNHPMQNLRDPNTTAPGITIHLPERFKAHISQNSWFCWQPRHDFQKSQKSTCCRISTKHTNPTPFLQFS